MELKLKETFQKVKAASKTLALLTDDKRNEILRAVADAIIAETPALLKANALDLAKMDKANPLYDRLQLTEQRLRDIAADMRHVSTLPSPLGRILKDKTLDNGLHLQRVSVPFGVIGMIYEARPNVTFDVFSLCFKSGNACVLKGGKDADASNTAGVALIRRGGAAACHPRGHGRNAQRRGIYRPMHTAWRKEAHQLCQRCRQGTCHRDGSGRGALLLRQGWRRGDGQAHHNQRQVPQMQRLQHARYARRPRFSLGRPAKPLRRPRQARGEDPCRQ